MKLQSVETTPNPNSMKLNVNVRFDKTRTCTLENLADCPVGVEALLGIEGVVSVFLCAGFLTLNRDPRHDWQPILAEATRLLGTESASSTEVAASKVAEADGQIRVSLLMFKGIPMQVKAKSADEEKRVGLSSQFTEAVESIKSATGADFIQERYWAEAGTRYGSLEDVLVEVAEEIEGLYPPERLARLLAEASGEKAGLAVTPATSASLDSPDWQERLRALEATEPTEAALAIFTRALQDTKPQIRRWAAARLGTLDNPSAVPFLAEALNDPNVGVRRTAGDSLSDIGDPSAQSAMINALSDDNKLVRWRAARYLFELGTTEALPCLERALTDPEYEVRLEVEAAIQRIQNPDTAQGPSGPVWKQMAQEQ